MEMLTYLRRLMVTASSAARRHQALMLTLFAFGVSPKVAALIGVLLLVTDTSRDRNRARE